MKSARFYGTRDVRIEEVVLPPLKEDDVKIEVEWCGLCGSDKGLYEKPFTRSVFTPGHEFSGTVCEIGSAVTQCKPGDRVIVNPLFTCGKCLSCRKGFPNLCENLVLYGLSGISGAFAEETTVKENMVVKIPDALPFDIAAVAEPTCIAAHALRVSKFKPGDTAAVFGTGQIGLLLINLLKISGCTKIIAVSRTASKLDLALKMGAHAVIRPDEVDAAEKIMEISGGVDLAFELSGAQQSFSSALAALRARGELVVISLPAKPISFDVMPALHKELSILTSQCSNGEFPIVAELLADGSVAAGEIVTKKIHLDDIVKEGYETLLSDPTQLKILVTPKRENMAASAR